MEREFTLSNGAFLVSETNEHGIITFANDDFCEIAGYTREELIGKPHNIVRHKDMPRAAFKDLWQTVQSGKVWNGFVKNAVKGGVGFYWVYATVYPIIGCDGKKAYMSCRKMATRDEIKRAEELYKKLN